MISEKEKKEFTEFLKAMVMNNQMNYATSNLALVAMLTNFTRETQIRAGQEKSEHAFKISEKIVEALPQDLTFEEYSLLFAASLLAGMMHQFENEAEFIQKTIKEAELKKTGTMYA